MTWAPDYVELEDLKRVLRLDDEADDLELAAAITAASRAIDTYCGRQFGQTDAAEVRTYAPTADAAGDGRGIVIDDVMDLTGLAIGVDEANDGTFSTTFTVDAQARLWPWNAAAEGRPYTELRTIGASRFPRRARAVQIEARWGWSEVPALVKQACALEAIRLFKRPAAPFGVAGSPELGAEPLRLLARLDPDVELMLSGLRRHWYAA